MSAPPVASRPVGYWEWLRALRGSGEPLAFVGAMSILASYGDGSTGANIRPSFSDLAERTGTNRTTWTRHASRGVACGWLVLVEDRGRHRLPNVYRLSVPLSADEQAERDRARLAELRRARVWSEAGSGPMSAEDLSELERLEMGEAPAFD